jgi:Fe(3+) dicitrate transport protein
MQNYILLTAVVLALNLNAMAQTEPTDNKSQTTIKVQAAEEEAPLTTGAMPPVYKNKIYKGKKATVTQISKNNNSSEANNTRQALHESSGVIVSDVNNQSYYSIGIRGLTDPHESQGVLLMSDDIPVVADFYGYPAAYYLPTMTSVESIEVTKTGAGLLYGSQPGGSVNFRLKQPQFGSFTSGKTLNTFGSNQLFTTFNSIKGGGNKLAYLIEGYQKTGAGQFKNNSGFNAYGFDTRIRYKINERHEIKNQLSFYKGRFEEAGGLALTPAAGRISIEESRAANTLKFDELLVDRFEARVAHEYKGDNLLNLTSTVWANNMSRESHRQNGSGFGVVSANNTNSIQDQDFYSLGARVNLAKDYFVGTENNTFTTNLTYYKMTSPFESGTGSAADAETISTRTRQVRRETNALALAAENQINVGSWAVTPSARAEIINQGIDETFNTTPNLRKTSETDNVLLSGLSLTYTTENDQQVYSNISEGFRPTQYGETVPTSSNTVVNGDLKSSKTLSAEVGIKGQVKSIEYDVSLFSTTYKNQIGTVTTIANTTLGNVGEGQYEGIDLSARNKINENVQAFVNSQFLKARFVSGPLDKKTPAYAPHYLHKVGVQHETDTLKHRLAATFSEEHYSDDNNTVERKIPSYNVWDLSGELKPAAKLFGANTKLTYGINNLFDAQYYSRVRATGIEPALERNYYAGLELSY